MTNNLNILIPDGDSTWALNVVNCLSLHKHLKLFVLSDTKQTAVKYSRFVRSYERYPSPCSVDNRIVKINSQIEKHQIDIVLPIGEPEIGLLTEYKSKILHAKVVLLPELEMFKTGINKYTLFEFSKTHGLSVPSSCFIESKD